MPFILTVKKFFANDFTCVFVSRVMHLEVWSEKFPKGNFVAEQMSGWFVFWFSCLFLFVCVCLFACFFVFFVRQEEVLSEISDIFDRLWYSQIIYRERSHICAIIFFFKIIKYSLKKPLKDVYALKEYFFMRSGVKVEISSWVNERKSREWGVAWVWVGGCGWMKSKIFVQDTHDWKHSHGQLKRPTHSIFFKKFYGT